MMIALAILAMGLLVIGAALPIGIRYTRASVNLATGQAAVEYALDLIEQNICLHRTVANCEAGLFQPRDDDSVFVSDYEPIIKVRPLFTPNIDLAPGSAYYGQECLVLYPKPDPPGGGTNNEGVATDVCIRNWLLSMSLPDDTRECAPPPWKWRAWPAISVMSLVYPPVRADDWLAADEHEPGFFLLGNQYRPRPVQPSEAQKAARERTTWVAFYRRAAYGAGSDPRLYEFIVVAVRSPSAKHRYPVQHPYNLNYWPGTGYAIPVPWLVTFDGPLPSPPGGPTAFDLNGFPFGPAPATLRFRCFAAQSGLFPIGAIIVPARNDYRPGAPGTPSVPEAERVGFSPRALDALPIYEVAERPDNVTVVVKFNGYYPVQGDIAGPPFQTPPAAAWPVWVVPPAFEELDSYGYPVFPERSPIVAVGRRYIRLRELP